MTLHSILLKIKQHKLELVNDFSVDKIGIFGSYAKGTQNEDSDIDVYVEFKEKSVDNLLGLMVYLDELFETKVDVLHKHKGNNKVFINHIKDDIVYG